MATCRYLENLVTLVAFYINSFSWKYHSCRQHFLVMKIEMGGNGWEAEPEEDADAISARELLATRSQPPACGLAGPTRPGPHSPRPPPARPTRDRCPLASDLLHNNTASFHFALFTLLVLSSFMYSTFTFVGSDDIIYSTLANNYFPLSTYRKHHPHDRPPNCGEQTGELRRARSALFGDPPPIAFGFTSYKRCFIL